MLSAREMYSRAAWTIAFALVVYYINRQEYPGPALQLAAVITLIGLALAGAGYGLHWIAGPGRQRIVDQIVHTLGLGGSERVLDAGSAGGGLGLAVARRLKNGKVIALGTSPANEAAREAAKNQGLGDRIRFEPGDPKKLSYPDANFDCVVSSQALSKLDGDSERDIALHECVRVLKPGGRIVIHEVGDTAFYRQLCEKAGLVQVRVDAPNLPLKLGGRVFSAKKS